MFLFFRVSVSHLGCIGPLAFLKVNWISFTPSGQSYSPVMCISPNPGCSGSASYPLSPHRFLLKKEKKNKETVCETARLFKVSRNSWTVADTKLFPNIILGGANLVLIYEAIQLQCARHWYLGCRTLTSSTNTVLSQRRKVPRWFVQLHSAALWP